MGDLPTCCGRGSGGTNKVGGRLDNSGKATVVTVPVQDRESAFFATGGETERLVKKHRGLPKVCSISLGLHCIP